MEVDFEGDLKILSSRGVGEKDSLPSSQGVCESTRVDVVFFLAIVSWRFFSACRIDSGCCGGSTGAFFAGGSQFSQGFPSTSESFHASVVISILALSGIRTSTPCFSLIVPFDFSSIHPRSRISNFMIPRPTKLTNSSTNGTSCCTSPPVRTIHSDTSSFWRGVGYVAASLARSPSPMNF